MAYNAAYRRDSLDAQTVALIAAIFNNNNQFTEAVDVTETYRRTDTLNVDVNRQNAKAYCMLKEYKISVNRYEALKAMGDRSFTTLYYLGVSQYADNWPYGANSNESVVAMEDKTKQKTIDIKRCQTGWKDLAYERIWKKIF